MKFLPLLLAMLACQQLCDGYRILGVFPLPGKSHWGMMYSLVKALADQGHQVDVITHFSEKNTNPNYREISIDGTLEKAVNNFTATDLKKFGSFSFGHFIYMAGDRVCSLLGTPEIQRVIKNASDPPYDLVITELFTSPCYLAFGRHFNVPVVGVVTSVLYDWLDDQLGVYTNPAFTPSLFSMFGPQMSFYQRLLNTLQMHFTRNTIRYLESRQVEYVKEYFGMDIASVHDLFQNVGLVLVNSHHSLNGVRAFMPSVVEVSGLHLRDDDKPLPPEVQKWLDESKDGCVYFTFGSMMRIETFPKPLIETFYRAFEKLSPVRVLMKIAKKEELPKGLPKNVMTQPWFSQQSVLKHKNVRAFLTHGGMMSTLEAIFCSVPMVGIPLFGDQVINIQNYANKKIAISLNSVDDVTEEKLLAALNAVLYDSSYKKNIQKVSGLFLDRPVPPIESAVYWVEYVARHGNILQSPAIHLAWWQVNLLDVYGTILLAAVVLLYVLLRFLRFLKNLFFPGKAYRVKKEEAKAKKIK